jgi:hypothetical protein
VLAIIMPTIIQRAQICWHLWIKRAVPVIATVIGKSTIEVAFTAGIDIK